MVSSYLRCLAAVVAASMLTAGCAGPVRYTRAVHESDPRYVKLDARYGYGQKYQYDGAAMRFAHPVSLDETDWARILKQIRIQPRKRLLTIGMEQTGPGEAFNEAERHYLARYLAQAFPMARPDEWVVFYLSHPREHQGGSAVTEVTSGGFFIEGGQLHLLLANLRYAVSMDSIRKQVRDDPLRPAGDGFYDLVPGALQVVRPVKIWDLTEPLRAESLEIVFDYNAYLSSPDKTVLEPDAALLFEERMKTLRRLYEKDLITEEEYRLERRSLLDDL